MRQIEIHQVDAFTNELFGGNPAGVVTNADLLSDDEMRKIAREMNLSETAFVLDPTVPDADLQLRFFTPPGDEIDFCGHATVGALFQLARTGIRGIGEAQKTDITVQTKAAVLPMHVTADSLEVTYTAPEVQFEPYRLQGRDFAKAFGIPDTLIPENSTILRDTKLNYVYIPTTSLAELDAQNFDFTNIKSTFGEEGIVVFCLFTNQTHHESSTLYARGLAPNVGVDEDPFTGSMQAALVLAAKQNGLIDSSQRQVITEQGHRLGRPGIAEINHDPTNNTVTITAGAVAVFSSQLQM